MNDHPVQSKSAELRTRILSAAILAPIVLGVVWVGGWPFALLMAAAGIFMSLELTSLLTRTSAQSRNLLVLAALVAVFLSALNLPVWGVGAAVIGLVLAVALRLRGSEPVWPEVLAYPYVVLPLVALIWLRLDPELGRLATFWLLVTVWATDTFAYFFGRAIGGPKLAPRLSPNKTWAGLLGGMFGAALVGAMTALRFDLGSPVFLALVGALLAVVAQGGDIFESALKRRAGVKDSGKLIPGHGGILDRVDGLVAAVAAAGLIAILHGSATPGAGVLIWP